MNWFSFWWAIDRILGEVMCIENGVSFDLALPRFGTNWYKTSVRRRRSANFICCYVRTLHMPRSFPGISYLVISILRHYCNIHSAYSLICQCVLYRWSLRKKQSLLKYGYSVTEEGKATETLRGIIIIEWMNELMYWYFINYIVGNCDYRHAYSS